MSGISWEIFLSGESFASLSPVPPAVEPYLGGRDLNRQGAEEAKGSGDGTMGFLR
jgi:hypothetical protein